MAADESSALHREGLAGVFPSTHWSVVLRAGGRGSPVSEDALARLCETYREPVLAYVRAWGHRPADAEDLAQGFLVHFLKRELAARVEPRAGIKFRSFLLRCVKNFLADERDRARARKRGGGQDWASLDESDSEGQPVVSEPADENNAALCYEREWARALLAQVLDRLEGEYLGRGRRRIFETLKPLLLDRRGDRAYADLAGDLGVSEDAVKKEVSRMRARYRELFREEVGNTVTSPLEVDEEINHLFTVLRR